MAVHRIRGIPILATVTTLAILSGFAGAGTALAAPFSTGITLICEGNDSIGSAAFSVTLDGQQIGETVYLDCNKFTPKADGAIVTNAEPNDWHVDILVRDRTEDIQVPPTMCPRNGDRLPDSRRCQRSPGVAAQAQFHRPKG